MDYGKHHHTGLDDAKALKKMNAVSHGEGCQNVDDEDHRMENLKMGLKHFVLKLSAKPGGQEASQILVRLIAAVVARRRFNTS